jgi:uracil-DNA glycosylase
VPSRGGLPALRTAARNCRGCNLFEGATQTVFSAGSARARVVLVGEQPGDQEDRRGQPFVGPAGRLLDSALAEAGIDRADAYVTNVVKHFRFSQQTPKGRRIHQTPDLAHISACRPWLDAELALVDPEVIVCLGAVAAKALLGPSVRVTRDRGTLIRRTTPPDAPDSAESGLFVATVHPSSVLRSDDREGAFAGLVADLRVVAAVLHGERDEPG